MTVSTNTGTSVPRDPVAFSIIDDMDTAIAVLFIGRDHGITPQADACMREVAVRCRDYLAQHRRVFAAEWAEVRHTWFAPGPEPAPMAEALNDAVRLIDVLIGDDRRAAETVRRNLRSPASVLPHFRNLLVKTSAPQADAS